MDDFVPFARLLDALRPWLGHLVLAGGWAHRLHRFNRSANRLAHRPLATRDADLAFAPTAALSGDIAAALTAAGFTQELAGDAVPPVVHYTLGGEHQGFFAEFLTPLRGDGLKRDGSDDVTVRKAGIVAQKLRYIDLLLIAPWSVDVSLEQGVPVQRPVSISVANPVSFIAQKLLIAGRRTPDKRAQDALYIHDTLELFGGELAGLREVWLNDVGPRLSPKTTRAINRKRREQFSAVTDVHRAAARIPQDRTLAPTRLQAACAYGLNAIFGSSDV